MNKNPCPTCGSVDWWFKKLILGSSYCSECQGDLPGPSVAADITWSNQRRRINDNATKNLDGSKQVYVPPLAEGHVGGVFSKE